MFNPKTLGIIHRARAMGLLQATIRSSRSRKTVSFRLLLVVAMFFIFLAVLALRSTTTGAEAVSRAGNVARTQGIEAHCPDHDSPCPKLPFSVAEALIHYATSNITPQQTPGEIHIASQVLEARSPCNFLVFGLGFDSLMWATLNHGGRTVFLEEDNDWIAQIARKHPSLRAYHVHYSTMVTQAKDLLAAARAEECSPERSAELASSACGLALRNLPPEIYNTQWDAIMIDAPRGYFPEAPGRMTAIYTAAVMARNRKKEGNTDIFVHDVDRYVEENFSKAFLCDENLSGAEGRLWHFSVPANRGSEKGFCSGDREEFKQERKLSSGNGV